MRTAEASGKTRHDARGRGLAEGLVLNIRQTALGRRAHAPAMGPMNMPRHNKMRARRLRETRGTRPALLPIHSSREASHFRKERGTQLALLPRPARTHPRRKVCAMNA